MTQHKFKLIIWDFDGVIADTEHLWVKNRQKMLNEKFNLDWDFATANKYLGGMSDKTKRFNLDKLGIKTDDKFWEDALAADYETMRKGFCLTKGIEKIFNDKNFKQCIATGGIRSKTAEKIKTVKIGSLKKYLPPIWLNTANRNLICFGWRPRQWENNRKTASL